MKKMMRVMALAMALLLMVAAVAGCGDTQTPDESGSSTTRPIGDALSSVTETVGDQIKKGEYDFGGTTIKIASPYETKLEPGRNAETDRLIERIKLLDENWNVKVEFVQIEADSYWDKMAQNIMGNDPFGDLMFAFPWYLTDWIGAGVARNVKPLAEALKLDFDDGTWNKMVLDDCTIGNEIYGMMRGYTPLQYGVVYNPKMLAAEGLTDPNELIKSGKDKWNYDVLRDYAQKLTKFDTDGEQTQFGLGVCGTAWIGACFILNNGGSVIKYDADGMPSIGLTDPKSLEGLKYMQDMAYVDKSMTEGSWDGVMQALLNGNCGMYVCEEWVLEDIQEYATENGIEGSYKLTYFPLGPSNLNGDFQDVSYGGHAYFIPTTISEDRAKAAMAVYAALYYPQYDLTKEEVASQRAEELLEDEVSAAVYVDIVVNDRAVSAGYAKIGLNEIFGYLTDEIMLGTGTPQSNVDTFRSQMESVLADGGYIKALKAQKGN